MRMRCAAAASLLLYFCSRQEEMVTVIPTAFSRCYFWHSSYFRVNITVHCMSQLVANVWMTKCGVALH